MTTPNVEYNAQFEALPAGTLRHRDHRFEWTRAEFGAWARGVADRHGYARPVRPDRRRSIRGARAARRRWRCSRDDEPHDPRALRSSCSSAPSGSAEVDVRAQALPADRGHLVGLLPRARLRRRERPVGDRATRSRCCTSSRASGSRPAGSPSSTRPTCSPRRASRSSRWPAEHALPARSRSCSTCPPSVCATSATQAAARPARSAPTSSGSQRDAAPAVAPRPAARRASGTCSCCAVAKRDRRGDDRARAALERTGARSRPVRHHRRRPRLPRRARRAAADRGSAGTVDRPTASDARHPDGRTRRLPRRPRRPRARRPRPCCGSAMGMVGDGRRALRPRQPRDQADARAARAQRHGHPRPRRDARPARRREPPEFRAAAPPTFIDGLVSHYVLDDGKLVVAHAGLKERMQGRGSGRGARVRALRRDHRRDRRVRPAGPLPLGRRTTAAAPMVVYGHTPVPEAEWLNNTICIDTGCVFGGKLTALRYPERELVLGAGARRSTTSRRGRSRRRRTRGARRQTRSTATCSTSTTSLGKRDRSRRALNGTGHDPRGERDRGARGDEPLRRRPALAGLPAADDVARRDDARARRSARAPGRGVRVLPRATASPRRLRGEAHGLARRRRRLPRRAVGARALRRRRRPRASSTRAPAGAFFADAALEHGAARPGAPPRSTAPDLWDELGTDWAAASTAS